MSKKSCIKLRIDLRVQHILFSYMLFLTGIQSLLLRGMLFRRLKGQNVGI